MLLKAPGQKQKLASKHRAAMPSAMDSQPRPLLTHWRMLEITSRSRPLSLRIIMLNRWSSACLYYDKRACCCGYAVPVRWKPDYLKFKPDIYVTIPKAANCSRILGTLFTQYSGEPIPLARMQFR